MKTIASIIVLGAVLWATPAETLADHPTVSFSGVNQSGSQAVYTFTTDQQRPGLRVRFEATTPSCRDNYEAVFAGSTATFVQPANRWISWENFSAKVKVLSWSWDSGTWWAG